MLRSPLFRSFAATVCRPSNICANLLRPNRCSAQSPLLPLRRGDARPAADGIGMSCQGVIAGLRHGLLINAESQGHGRAERFWNAESDSFRRGNFIGQH